MIRQQQKRLYFESETEEFYWEFREEEAAALADRLGFRSYARAELRSLGVADDGTVRKMPTADRSADARPGSAPLRDENSVRGVLETLDGIIPYGG